MTVQFVKATKKGTKARIALLGPSGSGKTFTAVAKLINNDAVKAALAKEDA